MFHGDTVTEDEEKTNARCQSAGRCSLSATALMRSTAEMLTPEDRKFLPLCLLRSPSPSLFLRPPRTSAIVSMAADHWLLVKYDHSLRERRVCIVKWWQHLHCVFLVFRVSNTHNVHSLHPSIICQLSISQFRLALLYRIKWYPRVCGYCFITIMSLFCFSKVNNICARTSSILVSLPSVHDVV